MSYKAYGGVHNVLDGEAELADIKSGSCHKGQLMTIQHTLYTAIYCYDPTATAKELLCRMGEEDPDETDFPIIAQALHGGPPGGDGIFVESVHMGDWGHLFIVPSNISDAGDYTDSPGRWVAINYVLYIAMSMDDSGGAGSGDTGHTMRRSIIPDTDNAYDIGSAEYKIRDLYVSDGTIWMGDKNKISVAVDGTMKFQKRILGKVPKLLQTWIEQNVGNDYDTIVKNILESATKSNGSTWFTDSSGDVYSFSPGDPISNDITIRQWLDIANILGMSVTSQKQLLDDLEDFEDSFDTSLVDSLSSEFNIFKTNTNASLLAKIGNAELASGLAGLDVGATALTAVASAGYELGSSLRSELQLDMDSKISAQNFSSFATVTGLDSKLVEAKNYADSVDVISKVTAAGFETGALLRGDLQTQMDSKIGAQDFASFASKIDLSDGLATKTLASLGGISAAAAGVLADTKIGDLDIAATAIAAVSLEGYAKTNEIESAVLGHGFGKAADLTTALTSIIDIKVTAGTAGLVSSYDVQTAIDNQDLSSFATVAYTDSKADAITLISLGGVTAADALGAATTVATTKAGDAIAGQDFSSFASKTYTDNKADAITLVSLGGVTAADALGAATTIATTKAAIAVADQDFSSFATTIALSAVESKADAADVKAAAADAKAVAAAIEAETARAKAEVAGEKADKGLADLDYAGLKR